MSTRLNHIIGSLGAAAVIAGVVAPVTLAGHEEYGVRCGLALSQHRPDAAAICAKSAGDRRRAAPTASVTIVEPGSFDWGDAGIGAAGTLGVISLAAGVVITSRYSVWGRA